MRELNCVIMANSQGWLLTVGTRRGVWFPSKDTALRAAIVEAQAGRAAGFYSSVKVQHSTVQESVRTDNRVRPDMSTRADVSDRSIF